MVSASDLIPEGREFEPWPVYPCCVLRQNTKLSQCLSPSRWETANCFGDNLTKCWGVTCDGLVSHPGGVEILLVASYYIDEPSGSPSYDWGRLYLAHYLKLPPHTVQHCVISRCETSLFLCSYLYLKHVLETSCTHCSESANMNKNERCSLCLEEVFILVYAG